MVVLVFGAVLCWAVLVAGQAPCRDVVYTFGGTEYNQGYDIVYKLDGGQWTNARPMPGGRRSHATAVVDNKVYAIGGYQAGIGELRSLLIFDPSTNTWTAGADKPVRAFSYMAAAGFEGNLYVFGGAGDPEAQAWVYNPGNNSWSALPDIPHGRSTAAAATFGRKIYLFGGTSDRGGGQLLADVDVYDPDSRTWGSAPNLPTARQSLASATLGDWIYVVGGSLPDGRYTSIVERYSPSENRWEAVAPLNFARYWFGLAVGLHPPALYAIGGHVEDPGNAYAATTSVEVYDAGLNNWRTIAPLPQGRGYFQLTAEVVGVDCSPVATTSTGAELGTTSTGSTSPTTGAATTAFRATTAFDATTARAPGLTLVTCTKFDDSTEQVTCDNVWSFFNDPSYDFVQRLGADASFCGPFPPSSWSLSDFGFAGCNGTLDCSCAAGLRCFSDWVSYPDRYPSAWPYGLVDIAPQTCRNCSVCSTSGESGPCYGFTHCGEVCRPPCPSGYECVAPTGYFEDTDPHYCQQSCGATATRCNYYYGQGDNGFYCDSCAAHGWNCGVLGVPLDERGYGESNSCDEVSCGTCPDGQTCPPFQWSGYTQQCVPTPTTGTTGTTSTGTTSSGTTSTGTTSTGTTSSGTTAAVTTAFHATTARAPATYDTCLQSLRLDDPVTWTGRTSGGNLLYAVNHTLTGYCPNRANITMTFERPAACVKSMASQGCSANSNSPVNSRTTTVYLKLSPTPCVLTLTYFPLNRTSVVDWKSANYKFWTPAGATRLVRGRLPYCPAV